MQQKISILGCGWLGLPLAEALSRQGLIVSGSTTTPANLEVLASKNITPFLLDLKNLDASPDTADFFQSEILVISIPPGRNPAIPYPLQLQKLRQILLHSGVKKVIFVSSTGVYAPSPEIITEKSELDIAGAAALIEAENIIAAVENTWQTTIVRFGGLFGPDRAPGRFLAGKTNVPAPQAPVNLIHQEDCIGIILEIIKQERWAETFNACADAHPSREVFYRAAARALQLPEPEFAPGTEKQVHKLISNSKVKTALSYRFLFPNPLLALQPVHPNSTEIN